MSRELMRHNASPDVVAGRMSKDHPDWKECAEALWGLLDDIDTYGDMYHPEITAYFKVVNKKAARRFEWMVSDGYSLSPNPPT